MWKKTTLGSSCKMYQPKTISTKEMVDDGKYVVFGANGIIGRYDKYNHEEPQLLVTCRGATCGSVNMSTPHSWITGNAMVIQPNSSEISMRYMEYVCRGGVNLTKAITGAAQPQITRKSLEPIEFSYPPLAEQQRIVAKLDAAFAEIDRAIGLAEAKETEIEKLKASLLSSLLSDDAVMWKTVKLGDVCDFQNGFAFKSALFRENGKPILRISNIQNEKIDIRKTVYFDAKDYDTDFTRYEVKPDDLLIAMSGATTGKIGFNKTGITYYLNQRVGNLKPKLALDKVFLYYLLSTKVQENLSISKGAAQPNLSSEQIKNIVFLLPPLAEQQRIVAKLDAAFSEIETANNAVTKSIEHYAALKSAILAQELQPREAT